MCGSVVLAQKTVLEKDACLQTNAELALTKTYAFMEISFQEKVQTDQLITNYVSSF